MSFDVLFHSACYDGTTTERINPFTNEKVNVPQSAPLPPDRVRAVRELLAAHGASEPNELGCYVVAFRDGSRTGVFGKDLERSCMVALRHLSDDSVKFVYDLLVAGDWIAVLASGDEPCVLAPSAACVANVPDDSARALVVASPREMRAALSGEFEAWRAYRDKVVGA